MTPWRFNRLARHVLRIRRLAVIASVTACFLNAVVAPTAHAGTIWVTDGGNNCNAFSVYGGAAFTVPSSCPMEILATGAFNVGQNAFWMTTAPPGITINSAFTPNGDVNTGPLAQGFVVGDFWRDVNTGAYAGSTLAPGQHWFNTGLEGSSNINSQIYGIQLVCTQQNVPNWNACLFATNPWFTVSGIELSGTENSAPYVAGQGSLWGSSSWVWNPPGDPWPVTLYASDVSGICSSGATVGTQSVNGPPEPRDSTVWQQCPNPVSWSFNVDTRSHVPTAGSFQITLTAANAAGVGGSAPAKTVSVDNDPVAVSFGTPNDANPTVWVNHAVTVDATPSAGRSGVGGMNCTVDTAAVKGYTGPITVNGDGTHTVSCTAWNKAVGPQGQPATGGASLAVKIDEAPPAVEFAPASPGAPTQVVANVSDTESGVASGSLQIAPAGTNAWSALPTSFDGSHLIASFDDDTLRGPYVIRAIACDRVGNCGVTSEQVTLPVRLATSSGVSFEKIVAPAKIVRKRVKVAGHYRQIRLVIGANQACAHKRVKIAPRRWRILSVCRALHPRLVTSERVGYGKPATVHGLLTTRQGAPLAGARVSIQTAPNNGLTQFTQATVATTDNTGRWTATLFAGPSRIIRAVYGGSATLLPAAGEATLTVPARLTLSVHPRAAPWGAALTITGRVLGGYVPTDQTQASQLLKLRIGVVGAPGVQGDVGVPNLQPDGRFSTTFCLAPGRGVVRYWFQAVTLYETNYPYERGSLSKRFAVRVGPRARLHRACG